MHQKEGHSASEEGVAIVHQKEGVAIVHQKEGQFPFP